jgi:hypothetical protein
MGGLFKKASGFALLKKWGSSSRPRAADALDRLQDRGAGMSAQQRAEFLAREDAKEVTGNGLGARTPLSSRYA